MPVAIMRALPSAAGVHRAGWSRCCRLRFTAISVLALLCAVLAGPAGLVEANRFGPPWLGIVTIDDAKAYTAPLLDAPPVGPLGRGAILPVLAVVPGGPGPDGQAAWYRTPVGYLPSAAMREHNEPWIAEVVQDGVPVFTKPDGRSGVRRVMRAGELLRVTGLSPGLDGEPFIWWATTEGWVRMAPRWPASPALWPASGPFAESWTMPAPAEAAQGRWGRVLTTANVRAAPTTASPIVGRLAPGTLVKVLSAVEGQAVQESPTWYRIDGGRYAGAYIYRALVGEAPQPEPVVVPPRVQPPDGRWIVIARHANTLTVVEHGTPIFATYVSLGSAGTSTPAGQYVTFGKFRYDDMTSRSVPDPPHPYDLPNVPSTQYFREGGYALHGTYWHDDFGTVHSLGCVNLTVTDGAYVFELTRPVVPETEQMRWSTAGGATPVIIVL
jgi:hypothetical protein